MENCQEALAQGRRALRRFERDAFEQAAAAFHEALSADSTSAEACAGLSETYAFWASRSARSGMAMASLRSKAMEYADRALSLEPLCAAAHRAMSGALGVSESPDPERRKSEAMRAVELGPQEAENWYEYWRAIGRGISEASLRRTLELDPGYFATLNDLGIVLCEAGALERAAKCLRKALTICPGNTLGLYNLAMILQRQGRYEEALKTIRQAVEKHPDDALLQGGLKLLEPRLEHLEGLKGGAVKKDEDDGFADEILGQTQSRLLHEMPAAAA